MRDLPYFKWYPADAETDEEYSAMNDTEVGFFHRCLNRSWINSGLPSDHSELARVLRVAPAYLKRMWVRVGKKFEVSKVSGRLVNRRQEEERSRAISKSEKATEAVRTRYERKENLLPRERVRAESDSESCSSVVGFEDPTPEGSTGSWTPDQCFAWLKEIGWDPRKISEDQAEAISSLNPGDLPATEEDPKTLAGVFWRLQEFDFFWKDYWRKVSKKEARIAYFKATTDPEIAKDIQRGLQAQIPEMQGRDPDKRPHATTWLNQERWRDEVVPSESEDARESSWTN